jgi:UPF0716 protein FxsA
MLLRILLLLILLSLAEVALLVWLSLKTSILTTVAIVLLAGFVGAALARWQGFKAWKAIRADLDAGRLPAVSVVDGVLVLLAGVFLAMPGLISDACGILLLLPPVRAAARVWLLNDFKRRMTARFGHLAARAGYPGGEVIDAEFRRADAAPIEHHPTP